MNINQGKLVVIDGIDGSGKTTQIELLKQSLALQGVPLEAISFPRYEDNLYGKLITRYLEGEFGSITQVNPYLMALAYAGDRVLAKPLIESWLQSGKLVIANRFVSSSKAHLSANLPQGRREEFIGWIDKLEHQTNGLPKPDLTILLNVNPKIGQKNALTKNKQSFPFSDEKRKLDLKDIHEESLIHLEEAAKIYLELAKAEENWQVVNCIISDKMRSKEDIHKDLIALLKDKLI